MSGRVDEANPAGEGQEESSGEDGGDAGGAHLLRVVLRGGRGVAAAAEASFEAALGGAVTFMVAMGLVRTVA